MSRFDAIQVRSNAAVLRSLSNATAVIGSQQVLCMFDNAHTLGAVGGFAGMGIATTQPRITCATTQVPADPVGQAVAVAGGSYVVAEHQPDGTGVSVLLLEVAA